MNVFSIACIKNIDSMPFPIVVDLMRITTFFLRAHFR
jgi:hypothetical protein